MRPLNEAFVRPLNDMRPLNEAFMGPLNEALIAVYGAVTDTLAASECVSRQDLSDSFVK
jgi:hypothetical protein